MKIKDFLKEFKEFALKGSVVDLAVGIIIGSAFNGVINSLVTNIILPPIGLVLNKVNFSSLFISLNGTPYKNIAEAEKANAPTLNYGLFLSTFISFLITSFVVFIIVREMNRLRKLREQGKEMTPTTKACPFCLSTIPIKATRCPQCTSTLA